VKVRPNRGGTRVSKKKGVPSPSRLIPIENVGAAAIILFFAFAGPETGLSASIVSAIREVDP
jgi:hypothetical protein